MRVACVHIEHFVIQVETTAHPELSGQPVVIGGYPHERKTVLDCSESAAIAGVVPGMALRQADHICPEAIFLPTDDVRYQDAFDGILTILDRFSPAVEIKELGTAFLDISGAEALFGPEVRLAKRIRHEITMAAGFSSCAGIANGKTVAAIAALLATPDTPITIRPGEEARFLEPLPLDLLPLTPDATQWLRRLGLDTVGQVASLPVAGLINQLGPEGTRAHQISLGIDTSPVLPRPELTVLSRECFFEEPIESVAGLLAAAADVLDYLVPQLRERHQACGEIKLRLFLDDGKSCEGTLAVKVPVDSKTGLLRRVQRHLEVEQLPGSVSGIAIGLSRLGREYGRQWSLSTNEKVRQREALERLAGSMQARFGYNPLLKVTALCPDSRIPERRFVLADFHANG